jgi:hypothetical protein
VVLYDIKIKKQKGTKAEEGFSAHSLKGYVRVADPAHGLIKYTIEEFLSNWISNRKDDKDERIAMVFEPSAEFHTMEEEKPDKTKIKFIFQYLRPYKKLIVQLFMGMLICFGVFCLWDKTRLPSVATHVQSKWLIKCIRNNAAMVKNVFVLSDVIWITCKSKYAINVQQTCIFMPFFLVGQ